MHTPQIEPITGLSRDYRAILAKLGKGPVFLAQRSRPAAALLSVQDYERMVDRLEKLEGLARAKAILARIDSGEAGATSHEQLKQEILERRVGHVGVGVQPFASGPASGADAPPMGVLAAQRAAKTPIC